MTDLKIEGKSMCEQERVAVEEEKREFRTGAKVGVVVALVYAFVLYFSNDLFHFLDEIAGLSVEFHRDYAFLICFRALLSALVPSRYALVQSQSSSWLCVVSLGFGACLQGSLFRFS